MEWQSVGSAVALIFAVSNIGLLLSINFRLGRLLHADEVKQRRLNDHEGRLRKLEGKHAA